MASYKVYSLALRLSVRLADPHAPLARDLLTRSSEVLRQHKGLGRELVLAPKQFPLLPNVNRQSVLVGQFGAAWKVVHLLVPGEIFKD